MFGYDWLCLSLIIFISYSDQKKRNSQRQTDLKESIDSINWFYSEECNIGKFKDIADISILVDHNKF